MKLTNEIVLNAINLYLHTIQVSEKTLIENYDISKGQATNIMNILECGQQTPKYMFDLYQIYQGSTDLDAAIRTAQLMTKNVKEAENDKPLTGGKTKLEEPEEQEGRKFIFTSAQNNTDLHDKFLQSLLTYCKENDARLIIGKYVYNKNGFQNGVDDDENIYYEPALQKYFVTEQKSIAEGLTWCGELNILPTTKHPLTGFAEYTGKNSSIIPHAKIALESIATAKGQECKMLYATGTVTKHNYIQKKAGQVAQAAHCYGALIVEIDQHGQWFVRQIQTDESGIFQDLKKVYHPDKVLKGKIEAINYGDLHAEKSDDDVLDTCEEMRDYLKPKAQFFHDTLDFTARNHHNRQSGHFLAAQHFAGNSSVLENLRTARGVLQQLCTDKTESYIVESNHDDALRQWLDANDYDFKKDPENAIVYLELQAALYIAMEQGKDLNTLEYALTEYFAESYENLTFLNLDDSLQITDKRIECGQHGHLGINGARGNPRGFMKLNQPMNTGHTHSAAINGNIYTAGVTGSLDMGYNKGAGNWSHSHIITYPSGFRTIVTFKGDGFYSWKA